MSEELVREILQNYYQKPFPKQRPPWLAPLELDGYNEELKLAFEYNGIQHYQFPNPFHKTYEEYLSQLDRDKRKVEECLARGINLLIVPHSIKPKYMRSFILANIPPGRE